MWRLVYVRDWFSGLLDRLVDRRIRRIGDRVEADVKRWMADNARRDELP